MSETHDNTHNGNGKTIKAKVTSEDGSFWFRISMWLLGILSTVLGAVATFILSDIRNNQVAFIQKYDQLRTEVTQVKSDLSSLRTFTEGVDFRTNDITSRFNKKFDEGVFAPLNKQQ